jgi:tRNA pseudouridine55 synthase
MHRIFAHMVTYPSLDAIKQGAMLLVDKPLRWTSFDVLNKIRRQIHTKIGHCGTLDPLATGLLICCTGKMTKQITGYQKQPKEYTGIIHLGATTPTYDLESEPEHFKPVNDITHEMVLKTTAMFTGDILQTPPIHSAIKKDGKPVYKLARQGVAVKLEPRPVTITHFEITGFSLPEVHFRVNCSTGTYIRSLANDFGTALGCGGYLQALRRTRIGDYNVEDAPTVDEWVAHLNSVI